MEHRHYIRHTCRGWTKRDEDLRSFRGSEGDTDKDFLCDTYRHFTETGGDFRLSLVVVFTSNYSNLLENGKVNSIVGT